MSVRRSAGAPVRWPAATSVRRSAGAPVRRYAGTLLLLCLPLLLAACAPADARTTLTVSNWAGWQELRLEQNYIDGFTARRPGVRVSLESVSNQAEYRDRILTSIAAGAPPDAFLLDNIDIPAFVRSGTLLDLAPYAARVGLPLEGFDPNVLAIFRRGPAVYALPKGFTPMVIAYNKDVFDRLGVPYPPEDWTWERFRATARALTRDLDGDGTADVHGFWLDRRPFMWIASLWALGGDVLCPDGTRASGCLDSPNSVWAFRALTGLATRDSVVPRYFGLRRSMGDHLRNFYSGRLAMVPVGHFWMPQFRPFIAQGRLRLGLTRIPNREGFPPATVLYASGFAVARNAHHKRLSVELAAYMVDSLAQVTRAAGGLEIPALTSLADQVAAADTSGLEGVFRRAVPSGRMPWGARIEKWREVEAVLPDIVDRIVMNGEDVEAVLRDVAAQLDRLLAPGPARSR
jgi:multiple sugar transport system substrate-binding protein